MSTHSLSSRPSMLTGLDAEILEKLLLDFLGNRIDATIISCRADYEIVGDIEKV